MSNNIEIKKPWLNLLKRAQSATRGHDGLTFLQMLVVVNNGVPQFWAEPKVVKLEPKLDVNIDMLRNKCSDEELLSILSYIVRSS